MNNKNITYTIIREVQNYMFDKYTCHQVYYMISSNNKFSNKLILYMKWKQYQMP